MGHLPETENDQEYLLVIGDYFTKWPEAYLLQDHIAQTVADVLFEQFVSRYGLFRTLHSDQGREFKSQLIAELCRLLHVKKTRSVPYSPKSDGLAERSTRTLKQMLSILVEENRFNWDDHIPYILMSYRASGHGSTKCTPNLLMLNRETNLTVDLMCGSPRVSSRICRKGETGDVACIWLSGRIFRPVQRDIKHWIIRKILVQVNLCGGCIPQ